MQLGKTFRLEIKVETRNELISVFLIFVFDFSDPNRNTTFKDNPTICIIVEVSLTIRFRHSQNVQFRDINKLEVPLVPAHLNMAIQTVGQVMQCDVSQ